MAAPTNTTLATATDIGTSLPVTITQAADFGGTTYDLWFSYTAQTDDTELGVFAYGSAVVYIANISFWLDVSTQYLNNDAQNRPTQIPITPGTTYYWRVRPNGGNPSPATLTMVVQLGGQAQLTAGLLALNDSTAGYPAVIMNPSTGAPVAFKHPFAAGEGVCVLKSGIVCAIDTDADGVKLYTSQLDLFSTPTMPATGYTECFGTNQIDTFWVGKNTATSTIVSIDQSGTVGTPVSLGALHLKSLAPNAANSIVYFFSNQSSANQAVSQVTVPGAVVSSFLVGVANYNFASNLLTLTDDTVLVSYERSGFATVIRRYNAAGAEQAGSPYTLAVDAGLERLFTDPSDPTYFWAWTQATNTNTFTRIKVSDGSTTVVGPVPKFVEGDYQPAASASPDAYFGADFSCVPWILRGTTTTTTYPIRRQRRFLLPSSPDNKRIQIPLLELLMRTGIGTADVPNPQIMMRISKDGGKTWGPERWRSAAAVGRWADRVRWLRATGNYRNAVCEITVSDPVDWQFLAMMAEPTEGSSLVPTPAIKPFIPKQSVVQKGAEQLPATPAMGTWMELVTNQANTGSGAVTSVTASAPIASSGGATPNISHNVSGVSAATYGDSTHVPQVAVNVTGHVTGASDVLIDVSALLSGLGT